MLGVTANGMFQPHARWFKRFFSQGKSVLVFLPLLLPFPNLIISHMVPLPTLPCVRLFTEPVQLTNLTESASFILSWEKMFGLFFCWLNELNHLSRSWLTKPKSKLTIAVSLKIHKQQVNMFRIRKTLDQVSCTPELHPPLNKEHVVFDFLGLAK